jgi:hypothetical protein
MIDEMEDMLFVKIQRIIAFYKKTLPLCDGRDFVANMQYKTTCGFNERAILKIDKSGENSMTLILASAPSFERAADKILNMLPIKG